MNYIENNYSFINENLLMVENGISYITKTTIFFLNYRMMFKTQTIAYVTQNDAKILNI